LITRISINLDNNVVTYMDSVCGGYSGRSSFIEGLICQHSLQNPSQQYVDSQTTYPDPELYNNTPRLHRRQKGFEQPSGINFKRSSRI